MKKETVIIVIMGLVIVALGGFLVFKLSGKNDEPASSGAIPPSGSGSPMEYQQRIAELEKIVAGNPNNLQAWTMLANEYYDMDQPQKAIAAYDKALGLSPNNPNLLTDQGVMYKRLGDFNRALANFEKAHKLDPKHLQSLYNMGIVYAEDLKQPENALKTWKHFLELDSTSPAAQQVKRMMAQTEAKIGKTEGNR